MANIQVSVPAARVSIMVNSAWLLGKGAITAEQYNLICGFMEGDSTELPESTPGYKGGEAPSLCAHGDDQHKRLLQGHVKQNQQPIDFKTAYTNGFHEPAPVFPGLAGTPIVAAVQKDLLPVWGPIGDQNGRATYPAHERLTPVSQATQTTNINNAASTTTAAAAAIVTPHKPLLLGPYKNSSPATAGTGAGAYGAAPSPTAAAAGHSAALSVSPRTAQDIKNEFALKVRAAAANNSSENNGKAPSPSVAVSAVIPQPHSQPQQQSLPHQQEQQQAQPPPHLRQPLQQQTPQPQTSRPQQYATTVLSQRASPQKPAAPQDDGSWGEKQAEDFKKRLALIGVPAATPATASVHRQSMTEPSPATAVSTTDGGLQENRKPTPAPTSATTNSGASGGAASVKPSQWENWW
ncbi:hypothetical protein Micbo1qcDRAFT_172711 [Microdochium bolleyi]|uniref:Uncharacterized protein n=1 Tax=Microdochium bolleyi TaxID=196109 RepID=A0A136J9U6_9PEZI|nr:hypothetical protein Micbo1qcDRAFT_172711 [Microdochium bolleyi]